MSGLTIPRVYPAGLPLYWKDEQSGFLPAAVLAYYNHVTDPAVHATPGEVELSLFRDYLAYVINAPCWDFPENTFVDQLRALRASVGGLQTCEDVSRWIYECLEIGLDPL